MFSFKQGFARVGGFPPRYVDKLCMTGLLDCDVAMHFKRTHPSSDGALGESHVAGDGFVLTSKRTVFSVGMYDEV